jgi:hypothetical protein
VTIDAAAGRMRSRRLRPHGLLVTAPGSQAVTKVSRNAPKATTTGTPLTNPSSPANDVIDPVGRLHAADPRVVGSSPTGPTKRQVSRHDYLTVVIRRRHLYDPEAGRLEEIGASYLPTKYAGGTFLEERRVVPKALFLCVEALSAKRYAHARDAWVSRLPTAEETAILDLPTGAPVLQVMHTALAEDGEVLEMSEPIRPADRGVFIDEYDVPDHAQTPSARSDI